MRQAAHGVARQRGVGRDHPVHAVLLQCRRDHADLGFVQIGRDLQEHGHAPAVFGGQCLAARCERAQQAVERLVAL